MSHRWYRTSARRCSAGTLRQGVAERDPVRGGSGGGFWPGRQRAEPGAVTGAPPPRGRDAPGRDANPGLGRPVPVDLAAARPGPHERLLHGVLSLALVPGHRVELPDQPLEASRIELGEFLTLHCASAFPREAGRPISGLSPSIPAAAVAGCTQPASPGNGSGRRWCSWTRARIADHASPPGSTAPSAIPDGRRRADVSAAHNRCRAERASDAAIMPAAGPATPGALTCFRCDRALRENSDRLSRPSRSGGVLLSGAGDAGQRGHRRLGGHRRSAWPPPAGVPAGCRMGPTALA